MGEIILDDVEVENLYPVLDEAFGQDFVDRLAEALKLKH